VSENNIGCVAVGAALIRCGGEPVLGFIKLACDHFLDIWVKRDVMMEDELAQHWH
jgi:hypothetical protein